MKLQFSILLFLFSCMVCPLKAQTVEALLRADSTAIRIGEPLKINLAVTVSKQIQLKTPFVKDTLGQLEVITSLPADTLTTNGKTTYRSTYIVSAYDSGTYRAQQCILFTNEKGEPDTITTNELFIEVATVDVDTTQPFKAIKAPLKVPYLLKEFTWYFVAGGVLILLLVLSFLLWRNMKNKKPVEQERPKPKDPAHVWARKELKKLDEEKLWQKDEVKQYYSRLSDILRLYLEYRFGWYAMESTTEEINNEIGQYDINDVAKELLLQTLRNADLAKFAKMLPAPDVNTKSLQNAFDFVEVTKPREQAAPDKA